MRIGLATVVATAIAIGAVVVIGGGGGGGSTGVTLANVWMSQNGSDAGANCVRSATLIANPDTGGTTLCKTFQKAYNLTSDSVQDVVGVTDVGGEYPAQNILGASHSQNGPQTIFQNADGQEPLVGVGEVHFGDDTKRVSFVTWDNIDVDGCIQVKYAAAGSPDNDVIQNSHVYNGNTACHLLDLHSTSNFTARNNELGPMCCGADATSWTNVAGQPTTSNMIFDGNYIHDIYDTCTNWPSTMNAVTACAGVGYGDNGTGDHVDGIHAWGCNTCLISNNRFYAINVDSSTSMGGNAGQGIYFEEINQGTYSDLTFINNMVACACGTNAFSLGSAPQQEGTSGYLKFLYNTVMNGRISIGTQDGPATTLLNAVTLPSVTLDVNDDTGFRDGYTKVGTQTIHCAGRSGGTGHLITGCVGGTGTFGIGTAVSQNASALDPGTTLTFVGNIATDFHSPGLDATNSCTYTAADGSLITATIKSNLTTANLTACDASNKTGTATFVSTNFYTPDLRLSGAQTAVNGGESVFCGPGNAVTTDLFGTARFLGSTCDIGAHESG